MYLDVLERDIRVYAAGIFAPHAVAHALWAWQPFLLYLPTALALFGYAYSLWTFRMFVDRSEPRPGHRNRTVMYLYLRAAVYVHLALMCWSSGLDGKMHGILTIIAMEFKEDAKEAADKKSDLDTIHEAAGAKARLMRRYGYES
jgi:hypothetical protein